MTSIPVISHNVIRQALDWSGFPEPIRVSTVSNFTFPNGKYQATLKVEFSNSELLKHFTGIEPYANNPHELLLELRECFCGDIIPVYSTPDQTKGITTVILSCTVEPHDYE